MGGYLDLWDRKEKKASKLEARSLDGGPIGAMFSGFLNHSPPYESIYDPMYGFMRYGCA